MKLYTGNFANLQKYAGLFPVSIALTAKGYEGACYRKLNPDWSYMEDPQVLYTRKFNQHLATLNPQQVYNELAALSKGQDVVLLCHEKEEDFCHRHLVARWLEANLNITVKELGRGGLAESLTLFDM
jgi:hypothetical protein